MTFFTLLQNLGAPPPTPEPTPIFGGGGGDAGRLVPISDLLPKKKRIISEVYIPLLRLYLRPNEQKVSMTSHAAINLVPIQIRLSEVAVQSLIQYNEARAREDEEIAAIMALMED